MSDEDEDIVIKQKPILERMRLDGRVALVTGAGQGIGRAYAFALAQAGASVAVVDIRKDLAEKVAAELQEREFPAMAIAADVTKRDEVDAMVHRVLARFGNLAIAVNNAGIGDWMDAEQVTDDNWQRINDVNLKGVLLCCQAESRVMFEQGFPLVSKYAIINTCSMSATIVNFPQHQVVYNTTKAGVKHMTKSLAVEWASRGIKCNCISPGYTKTALLVELLKTPQGKDYGKRWLDLTPAGRFGEVSDLMGAVVYLASEASDFMTGHDLVIDGGFCAL